jgi:hypothetical protein
MQAAEYQLLAVDGWLLEMPGYLLHFRSLVGAQDRLSMSVASISTRKYISVQKNFTKRYGLFGCFLSALSTTAVANFGFG